MNLGLRGKLFVISLLLIGGVGLTVLIFFESRLRDDIVTRTEADLLRRTKSAAGALALVDDEKVDDLVASLASTNAAVVVVVTKDGQLRADSRETSTAMTQTEVAAALEGQASSVRRSHEDGVTIDAAAPFPSDGPTEGAVWMRVQLRGTDPAVADLRALLALACLVGLALAVFMSGVASELMARTMRAMVDDAVKNATGESPMDSQDEVAPPSSRSFGTIAKDLHAVMGDLAEERDRLETILEQMRDAVLVLDGEGRVSLTNDAANRLLAMDDDDVGRPLLDAVQAPALAEIASECARRGDATLEFELKRNRSRQVLAHAASIRNDGGVVIVMHDVTEMRRLENVRRDFVANVSHELRTPVTVIRANAETLMDGALEDEDAALGFVEGIHRSAERLTALISDLLDLSKIEAGHYATKLQPVPLRGAVNAVVDGLLSQGEHQVAVVNEIGAEVEVLADTTGLGQILQNLLDNAIKYTPDEGHVWVRVTPSNDVLRIEVEDDGPGIEPGHRKRVFERFYRIDAGRSRTVGGTGLGLSIVKHLAEKMGGAVGVEAAQERGSVFWVELKRAS